MKLKKFALRGMIVLAAVIALCVLFSGTIRSLTTAKVDTAYVKNGKFEKVDTMQARVAFPDKEEYKITIPEGLSLTVESVPVAVGQKVRNGETLLYTKVKDMDKELTELQKKYDEARVAIENWNRKHSDIRLTRNEEAWMKAYYEARDTEMEELNLRQHLMAEMDLADAADLTVETLQKSKRKDLVESFSAWLKAKDDLKAAKQALAGLERYAISDDVWSTLQEKRKSEDDLQEAENRMMEIRKLSRQMSVITAPHEGYIAEVKVRKGDTLTGEFELLQITVEGKEPVLRAELDLKTNVQKGSVVTIPMKDNYWWRVETKIIATGITNEGRPYADAAINRDVTDALGNISSLIKKGDKGEITLKITSRAKEATCLIDAAAVRTDGDGKCVYYAQQVDSALGGTHLVVMKYPIKVLAENEDVVSVEDDLTYLDIIYNEDRYIKEGDTVMWYEK